MGFRCSILGCEYERAEPERNRERRGDEVVHTVREFEECSRCGDRRLVSENTGVTVAPAVEADGSGSDPFADAAPDREVPDDPAPAPPDDGGIGDLPETDGEDAVILGEDPGADVELPDDPAEDTDEDTGEEFYEEFGDESAAAGEDVEFIDAGDTDADADADTGAAEAADPGTDPDPGALVEEAEAAETATVVEPEPDAGADTGTDDDDAVFIDGAAGEDGAQAGARSDADTDVEDPDPNQGTEYVDAEREEPSGEFGEWPDENPAEEPSYDHDPWPDPTDTADEGFDATPTDDDGGLSFSGLTPEDVTEHETEGDAEVLDAGGGGTSATTVATSEPDRRASTGGHDAAVEHGPGAQTTRTEVAGELHCPRCGFSGPPERTPHRSGDICPECAAGYLTER